MRSVCEFKVNGIGGRDEYGRRVCGNCGRAEELHAAPPSSAEDSVRVVESCPPVPTEEN